MFSVHYDNKFGNSAQPLGDDFHQEEGCGDAWSFADLIRLGHGDQFSHQPRSKITCQTLIG